MGIFCACCKLGGKELTAVSKQMGIPTSELKKMYKEASKASGSLEDFANVTGRTSEEFAQLFKSNPSQALIEFIQGLKDSENTEYQLLKCSTIWELQKLDYVIVYYVQPMQVMSLKGCKTR